MNNQEMLNKAITIAINTHRYQYDKGGKPYILHPLRIMTQLLHDTELASIGVLHDVIEDRDRTIENLVTAGFSPRITDALTLLTHRKEDSYKEYIEGICTNYDAIKVKRKDIEDNCDVTRLKGVSKKDLARVEKYHKAFTKLGKAKLKFKEQS